MIDTGQLVSAETAVRLCEEYAALFPELVQRLQEERLKQKCLVEFVLDDDTV